LLTNIYCNNTLKYPNPNSASDEASQIASDLRHHASNATFANFLSFLFRYSTDQDNDAFLKKLLKSLLTLAVLTYNGNGLKDTKGSMKGEATGELGSDSAQQTT
jgi:hypothetical protein